VSDNKTTVIFDLGNVILPFDPYRPGRVLGERAGISAREALVIIYKNNLERRFEQGLLDGDQFTAGVAAALGIDLEPNGFHDLWCDMFDEDEAVSEIVRQLKPHHRLVLLSNINPWHWEYVHEKWAVLSEFDAVVLSYEVGVLKPHPAIYGAALEKAGSPERAIFIDDMEINAAGAQVLGITGVHFQSASQLREELIRLGCKLD
jgi:putative hydrolase of the HAD superfamily